ncbi:hypothetical protein HDU87_003178 [Geranomyces variabilis]|uniref:Mitochondrial genome maintenance protein MGM101 n=1 Tax=Geranomyces variabilis TaxID=109894 RepID=A0AAD5TK71_9FUNG|nr:hypothetical protein HDU87_003178 [Geranomyces variabilis]
MSVSTISHRRILPRLRLCLPQRTLAYASSSSSSSSSSPRTPFKPPLPKPTKSSPKRREFHPLPTDTTRFTSSTTTSYSFSQHPFSKPTSTLLARPVTPADLEIDPLKGYLYLSEPAYHALLNSAFGPKGDDDNAWDIIPLTPFHTTSTGKTIYRAYALVIHKQFVSEAIGDALIVDDGDGHDAVEEAKRRCEYVALVRCAKDLGIASELWDPRTVSGLRAELFEQQWVTDEATKKKKRVWARK